MVLSLRTINLLTKRIKVNLYFKLSYLNSNFELTLGYLNPALNNPAQLVVELINERREFASNLDRINRVWGKGSDPVFPLLFHDNPAFRTSGISIPNTVFVPDTASCSKILTNSPSRVAIKSRIPSQYPFTPSIKRVSCNNVLKNLTLRNNREGKTNHIDPTF